MSWTAASAGAYLDLLLNATTIANVAENASSSPITSVYVSLHTATPGSAGNQSTNEAAYTGYARVSVVRTSSGWSISGDQATPVAAISFPAATGGSETETYMGIGTSATGPGNLWWYGAISPTIVVSSGVTPQLTTSTTITGT